MFDIDTIINDRQTLQRLIAEHRMLKEAIQFSPVHFCVYDDDDCLIAWNPSYEEIYPETFSTHRQRAEDGTLTYGELIRSELRNTLAPDALEQEVRQRVQMQREADGKSVIRHYNDRSLRVHKYPLPSGAIAGLAVDITDMLHYENELIAARAAAEDAARARTQFLATMSHEIRTPMNGVIGVASIMEEGDLTPDQRANLQTIIASGEALLETINEILDFSKLDAGKIALVEEPFDLEALVGDAVRLLEPVAASNGLVLRKRITRQDRCWFRGDATRIRQCILNLVGNALKFTPDGSVDVNVACDGTGRIRIEVADTGIGIPPERIGSIFSAFEQIDDARTRQFDGTGLGLTITRQLVELMSGTIRVTSEAGKGSVFTINLVLPPSVPENTSPSEVEPGKVQPARFDGLAIVLAEDNRMNRVIFEKMLANTGALIQTAENGLEAIDMIFDARPDLVFMDMSMPVLSGLDATRQIRQDEASAGLPPVPIIALTANAMEQDRKDCADAGMSDFLAKPFRKPDLIAMIRQWMS